MKGFNRKGSQLWREGTRPLALLLWLAVVALPGCGVRPPEGFARPGATESEFAREYLECNQPPRPAPQAKQACAKGGVCQQVTVDTAPQNLCWVGDASSSGSRPATKPQCACGH